MTIIIEHKSVKRKLQGNFRLCISDHDARSLISNLQLALENGHSYGWIDVYNIPRASSNTEPLDWDE